MEFEGNNLILTTIPEGERVELNRISDREFEDVISQLNQVGFPLTL